LRALLSHVDVIRLDHFRAFTAAWHVPAGAPTAEPGSWKPGPGAGFLTAIQRELGSLPFIAEDLGLVTTAVYALRDQFRLPGMRILQFGFDGNPDNPHLPHNYTANTVAYTGTHDNSTTRGWFEHLPEQQRRNVWNYLKRPAASIGEAAPELIELAWASIAGLTIAPLQDLLNLGDEARMNVPGRSDGNWRWRCTESMLNNPAFEWLSKITESSNRFRAMGGSKDKSILEVASR
jgi:4-alpha-glucanotransferase